MTQQRRRDIQWSHKFPICRLPFVTILLLLTPLTHSDCVFPIKLCNEIIKNWHSWLHQRTFFFYSAIVLSPKCVTFYCSSMKEKNRRERVTKGRHLMSDSSHRILFFYSFTNVIVRHSLKCAVHIYSWSFYLHF